MLIEITDQKLFDRFQQLCRRSHFIKSIESGRSHAQILLNTTSIGNTIHYRCRYDNSQWCQNLTLLNKDYDALQIQHPSSVLCSRLDIQELEQLLRNYLKIESILNPPNKKQKLSVYTWPCSSYGTDPLFDNAPQFVLIVILILIDGCILFAFNYLFHELIEEKSQGITELLRLISIRPILNSLAWFLRVFMVQLIISILLIIILKISFDGTMYLSYVSIWLIIPTILLWMIQVLSRSVLVAHFFHSNLKATLWSWLIYFISFWLACSSAIRLPMIMHLMASAWLPFYSIKRLFILLFRINTDLGRSTGLVSEIIFIWISMLIGILLIWLLAYYLEQIFPGKYGIPRPWTWPLDYLRYNRVKHQKRRESVAMQMVETMPDVNTTVRVNNLTKTYGRFHTEQQLAVDHVSFKLEKSTIHGLIGHNGAGKTSTMEMMCGLLSCDCGNIEIHDRDLYENLSEIQKCIGYCPQHDMLFSHLTVTEQLEFYARVRSKENAVDNKQIQDLLKMMDMNTDRNRLCHTLSGGMQRKLSILCAFVGQANVILLGKRKNKPVLNEIKDIL
jgi:ABC-type lipopolysaccharide export system ATPase subunit